MSPKGYQIIKIHKLHEIYSTRKWARLEVCGSLWSAMLGKFTHPPVLSGKNVSNVYRAIDYFLTFKLLPLKGITMLKNDLPKTFQEHEYQFLGLVP